MSFWLGGEITEVSSIVWGADPWQINLGMALGLIVLVVLYWTRRAKPMIALEMALWMLVVALLVFANADPRLISDAGSDEQGKTVVLIDSSVISARCRSTVCVNRSTVFGY